jgi:diacylglycerol kinase (ATP)
MKKKTGLARLVNATGYSMAGLKAAFKSEAAFRQETVAAVILIPLGIFLAGSDTQRQVLVVELLNSGIEAIVDRVGSDFHPLSKQAKDMGSAAVFVSIAAAILVWLLILI